MREVLISIQPKWVEKIVRGEKTVEVRKTRPNCEVPFKCYIYCTQGKLKDLGIIGNEIYQKRMKVIGEFVCDRITKYECSSVGFGELATTCGTCLTYDEILNYCNGNDLYGWHITDFVAYDEPRELSEFEKSCEVFEISFVNSPTITKVRGRPKFIERPPRSWCYIEPRQTAD